MKKSNEKRHQYTIRGVPEQTDKLIREKALEYGSSLNETALKVLQRGLGQDGELRHRDFEVYAGTWVQDDVFDDAIKDFEKID